MNQEIFADGISAIHVTGNLVRLDLMTVQPQLKSDNGQPVVEVNRRIIMPLEGFIQSLSTQQDIVKQLIAAGILKQNSVDPIEVP
ncbi:hypothetical protein EV210_106248 [Anaerospora hongkongensis]|jgi:hypothetical protein|uniref:Uncharacterized protein n=1 Tax=Anaerospora hongkongensis TaxID=244830 RepID=A0A4R1PXL0_9FIRM|nr:hypothetical protein [Anaerospora hongkongensis]TCL37379.1 hypothetical protein EV210_106248 [Anaerospora hongkongensis]